MPAYIDKKNVELFTKHAVLTETEMRARYEIHLENYCKVSAIEANTLLDMAQRSILPVAARYSGNWPRAWHTSRRRAWPPPAVWRSI